MMVHIKIPIWTTKPNDNLDFSWWITTQVNIPVIYYYPSYILLQRIYQCYYAVATQKSTPHCNNHFEENTGTIKSPNYPTFYPNSVDCRWNIKVEPGSKVRLLFALFETQADADYLYVSNQMTTFWWGINKCLCFISLPVGVWWTNAAFNIIADKVGISSNTVHC